MSPLDNLADHEFVPLPTAGRTLTVTRRVRWGDTDVDGALRLDAVARYLQDVANDDTRDAGLDPYEPWVVRRTALRIDTPLRNGEPVEATTWSGGHGRRWAERRTSLVGADGGRIEAAALWVCFDAATGRPAKRSPRFHEIYGEAASGREVGSRLRLSAPPADVARGPFPLRSTDFDALGHVNNAVTWTPVQDCLATHSLTARYAELEYPGAIEAGDEVTIATRATDADDGVLIEVWVLVDGNLRAAARVRAERAD